MYINTVKFQKDQKNFYDFLGPFYLKKTRFFDKMGQNGQKGAIYQKVV